MEALAYSREGVKCQLAAEVLRSFGELRLRVTGSSMLPSVRPGDTLCIRRQGAMEAQPGDIVLFVREGRLFAHRLVSREGSSWITRGDSLPQNDPPVSPDELLGRVTAIVRGETRGWWERVRVRIEKLRKKAMPQRHREEKNVFGSLWLCVSVALESRAAQTSPRA